MDKIIQEFKSSSFYQELFETDKEILLIYVGGSRSTGIVDENSDYDIVILTKDGEYEDINQYAYLRYKDKTKIHWYYNPISKSLKIPDYSCICGVQIKNLRDELIIYKNSNHNNFINNLMKIKNKLSNASCYKYFELHREYIKSILASGMVTEENYSKILYHLCLASYYITGEEPAIDFLRTLKRIKWQPVPDEYKDLAIERLKVYKNHIEQNPLNLDAELEQIYYELLNTSEV